MKKILITGITGFAGSHLAEYYLKQDNVQLWGIRKWRSNMENIRHIEDKIMWKDCDITDSHSIEGVVKEVQPDVIHHLAAMSFVPSSWMYPQRTIETNVNGTLNILEAIRKYKIDCVVQVASSSEIYGIQKKLPITEENLPEPCSPYAVSKLAMDRFAAQYYKSFGIKTIISRAFNHTGPRRGSDFVCSTFAKQIAEIEIGKKEPIIKVGNLDSYRDFTDVRDMVRAYALSIDKCEYGQPYNIASGEMIIIQEVLDLLLSFSSVKTEVVQDPERMRPSDLNILKGDTSKFIQATQWKRAYSIEQTLKDLLEYWREQLTSSVYS